MNTTSKAILASVAVIALCLCAVGGVTYSWFSDSEQADIDVTTGTIDLDMTVGDVTVQSYGGEQIAVDPASGATTDLGGTVSYITTSTDTTTILTITFQNAAPGDKLEFNVSGTLTNSIDAAYYENYSVSGPALASPFTIDGLSVTAGAYQASSEPKTLAEKTVSISIDTSVGNEYQGAKFEIVIVFEAIQENAPQTPSTTTDIETGSNSVSVNNASGESATIQFDNSGASPVTGTLSVSMIDVANSDYAVTDGTVLAGISVTPSEGGSNLDGIATTVTFQIDGDLSAADLNVYHDGEAFTPTGEISKTYDPTTGKTTVSFVTSSGFSTYVLSTSAEAVVDGTYYNKLNTAKNNADGQTIVLLRDVSLNFISGNNLSIAIDMDGHKISAETGFKISGGTFSLKNGTFETTQGRSQIYNGCEATISNVVMNMKGEIWVGSTNSDQSSYQSSDTLKLVDVAMNTSAVSKYDTTAGCVIAMKNSKIIVEGGTFTNTEGVAFATSGDANTTGQDWSFINAVFNVSVATNDCIGVAIQCHNSGTWKIEGCTFNMDNGVALSVRGGNVTVTDCTYNYTNSAGSAQSGQLQGTSVDSIVVQVPNAIATWYSEGSYGYGENSSLSVDGTEQTVTADGTVRYVGF